MTKAAAKRKTTTERIRQRRDVEHQFEGSLGARLRALRLEREFSIAELARQVGVTSGLISQVETGKADPSFTTLRRIARALGVPIFYLFIGEPLETRVRGPEDRFLMNTQDGEVQYEFLSDPNDGQVEFTIVRAQRGSASGETTDSHPGRECALILNGRMRLEIDDRQHDLGPSESITFDALRPHRWKNVGEDELRFVSVMSLPYLT